MQPGKKKKKNENSTQIFSQHFTALEIFSPLAPSSPPRLSATVPAREPLPSGMRVATNCFDQRNPLSHSMACKLGRQAGDKRFLRKRTLIPRRTPRSCGQREAVKTINQEQQDILIQTENSSATQQLLASL